MVFLKRLLLVSLVTMIHSWSFTALTGTLKVFMHDLDSSCIIFLYTRKQFDTDRSRITRVIAGISGNLNLHVSVAALSFQGFGATYQRRRGYMECKSPTMLIIHTDRNTVDYLENVTHSVAVHDMRWIWYGNDIDIEEQFKKLYVPFSCQFVVAKEKNDSYVELRQLYRVSPSYPLRDNYFGFWTPDHHFIPTEIIYNRRNNLEGVLFRTGSTQNPPIHWFERGASGAIELRGYFPLVWQELASILNFTSEHLASVDNVTGIQENGSWNGLIGMIHQNQIDVAVSEFIMDSQRTHVVEFSRPLVKSSYQVFFRNVGINYNWDAILRPFETEIWLAALVWILVGSVAMALAHHCESIFKDKENPQANDFNFINSVIFYVKTICYQGHHVIPRRFSTRVLFLTGYMTACVLNPSYSASLISYLTFRTPKRPFDNLQSLLEVKSYKLQTNAKTAEYTYFSEATDPTLQMIFREMMSADLDSYPLNTQDALDRVCSNSSLAHFGDMAVATAYLDYLRQFKKCDIVTLSQGIGTVYSSMAFRRNSPYRNVINHYLQRMEDCGLVRRLYNQVMPRKTINHLRGTNSVELLDVAQTFILLIIGKFIALAILVVEMLHYRWVQSGKFSRQHRIQLDAHGYTSKNIARSWIKTPDWVN